MSGIYTVLLVIHTILVLFLIGIILIQRSSDDGLGGLGGNSNVFSGRAAGNALTRITAILAAAFICTSLALAIMVSRGNQGSILDAAPVVEAPAVPSVPKPE